MVASYITTARPYAKALFSSAVSADLLNPWAQVLAALSLIAEDECVTPLMNDPKVSGAALKDFFSALCRTVVPDSVSPLGDRLDHLLSLLIEAKRITILPHIAALYHQLLAEQKGVLEVDVTSAFALNASQQENFKRVIEARFKSDVSLAFHEDASLIGGAIIRSNKWVIDSSVRGQLTGLKDCLSVE